jgi:hypothetical protein
MSEKPQDSEENPLDDLATELSEQLSGKSIEISDSTQTHVEGGQISMKQSAARSVQASALHMEESAAALVRSGSIDAVDSAVGVAFAREMHLEKSNSSFVVAQTVDASDTRAFVVLATQVKGNLNVALTPLTAFSAGAGFALALWLLRAVAGRFARTKASK